MYRIAAADDSVSYYNESQDKQMNIEAKEQHAYQYSIVTYLIEVAKQKKTEQNVLGITSNRTLHQNMTDMN